MAKFTLLQITDCHLLADKEANYRGQNPYQNFLAVLAVAAQQQADALLLTGDLAQDEKPATYQLICKALPAWPTPIYYCSGNHDDPKAMQMAFKQAPFAEQKSFTLGNWQIILLNSKLPYDTGEGKIDQQQLEFLQQQLQQHQDKFIVIAVHHHVLPVNGHMDNYALQNVDQLLALLTEFDNVKVVLSGHVHQQFEQDYQGIKFLTAPSTCYQITPGAKKYQPDNVAPGFRVVTLLDDGSFDTVVQKL